MRLNSVINLLIPTIKENDIGDLISSYTKRKIFAEKKSVRQSEFYQAAATGLKPEIAFQIWTRVYNGEEKIEYGGKTYTIVRIFEKGEVTELICEGVVNNANA